VAWAGAGAKTAARRTTESAAFIRREVLPYTPEVPASVDEAALLTDLRDLIQSARQRIATVANATTPLRHWHFGRRLLTENLQDSRAAYGQRILATVSRELTAELGGGFGCATVNRAIQFAQFFPDPAIVSTLSQELSWSHFIEGRVLPGVGKSLP
jgi:hypothetical protein